MLKLRLFDVDRDCEASAVIRSACSPWDATAEDIACWHRISAEDPTVTYQRMVAEDETGRVVGFAVATHEHFLPEGTFHLVINVAPEARGRGVGTLLYQWAEDFAREHGARELEAYCRGEDEASNRWTLNRGFHLDRERTESLLNLKDWDGSRFAGHLERVAAGGIRLLALRDAEIRPFYPRMYELDREAAQDVPGLDGGFPPYESWVRNWQNDPRPVMAALALDGDRVVGDSVVMLPRNPGKEAGTDWTGVLREYRSRGIALAVKLLTIEAAIAAGAPAMRTNNDPDNPAMLRVNEKLGYRMVPGPRRYRLTLSAAPATT